MSKESDILLGRIAERLGIGSDGSGKEKSFHDVIPSLSPGAIKQHCRECPDCCKAFKITKSMIENEEWEEEED
jgi:hypothetical protein